MIGKPVAVSSGFLSGLRSFIGKSMVVLYAGLAVGGCGSRTSSISCPDAGRRDANSHIDLFTLDIMKCTGQGGECSFNYKTYCPNLRDMVDYQWKLDKGYDSGIHVTDVLNGFKIDPNLRELTAWRYANPMNDFKIMIKYVLNFTNGNLTVSTDYKQIYNGCPGSCDYDEHLRKLKDIVGQTQTWSPADVVKAGIDIKVINAAVECIGQFLPQSHDGGI